MSPSFAEGLQHVSFSELTGVLEVHASIGGVETGRLAVSGNPVAYGQPQFSGSPGLWHGPCAAATYGLRIAALDFATCHDAYRIGASATLMCVDPAKLASMDGSEWTSFLESGAGEEICRQHASPWMWAIVSSPGTLVHPSALDAIAGCLCPRISVPILQLPEFELVVPSCTERLARNRMRKLAQRLTTYPCRGVWNTDCLQQVAWEHDDEWPSAEQPGGGSAT